MWLNAIAGWFSAGAASNKNYQCVLVVIAFREERAVAPEIFLIHGGCRLLSRSRGGARGGPERQGRAQAGIEITVTKSLLERREGRLAGAVTGRDVRHLELVAQSHDDVLDVRVLRHHQVESAGDEMDARVDRRRRFHNLVDAGMRAADDENDAVGSV